MTALFVPSPGTPCWYELATTDVTAAEAFYAKVLGWSYSSSQIPGVTYEHAQAGTDMVAGLRPLDGGADAGRPPSWLIYYAVADCDASARTIGQQGGQLLQPPTDIPRTGRFAVAADPQGAVFGILQPAPMQASAEPTGSPPYDMGQPGHGQWHELMSTDPKAALEFYAAIFGWQKSEVFDMGEMGSYQLFGQGGEIDLGGMMGLGNAPQPCWLPYFGVDSTDAAIERIRAAGGTVVHGPMEVPGGAFIAVAQDAQQAHFAVVGQK